MAVRLLAYEVSDLCLGKPPLRSLPASASLADAVSAIKYSEDGCISVWNCDHSSPEKNDAVDDCRCAGKICMVDVICYLCREENLLAPSSALKSPVSELVSKGAGRVRHVEPSSSLFDAIDLILQGAQNLVVPLKTNLRRKLQKSPPNCAANHGREFCWLTQEDVIRFLLSSIGVFTPLPALSIDSLGAISTEFSSIGYHSPAASAVGAISSSLAEQTSVAVVDDEGILIGEISPFTLACCDEMVAAAITTLSAGDLMAYIDCGGPPEDLVRVVKARLEDRKLEGMLVEFTISTNVTSNLSSFSLSSSSDEESSSLSLLPTSGRYSRSSSYSARMVRRAEAIVCHPWSSLAAVMIQAISHRVNYVWVVEEDCSLAGIVTFSNMLKILYQHLQSMD